MVSTNISIHTTNFFVLADIVSVAAKSSSHEPLDQEDQVFIQYINFILKDDIQIAQLLPVGNREVDVSSSCVDGVILWLVSFCIIDRHCIYPFSSQ